MIFDNIKYIIDSRAAAAMKRFALKYYMITGHDVSLDKGQLNYEKTRL